MQYYSAMMIKKQHNELIYKSSAMIFFCYFFSSFSNFFWCKYKWKKKILKKATLENASNLTPTRVYLKKTTKIPSIYI